MISLMEKRNNKSNFIEESLNATFIELQDLIKILSENI